MTRTHTVTTTQTVTTSGGSTTPASACTGDDVQGSFDLVPGSAGAGQIAYRLTLTNTSSGTCFVSGVPALQLLDANGGDLPTHVVAAPGQGTAARITLQPGDSAIADARFSPDVPGQGDRPNGPCQPKAFRLVVTLSGAVQSVAISPPTRVCEQGTLDILVFSAAG